MSRCREPTGHVEAKSVRMRAKKMHFLQHALLCVHASMFFFLMPKDQLFFHNEPVIKKKEF